MPAVTVTTRGDKGSALTWDEVDANFDNLAEGVAAKNFVSDYGADPTGVANSDSAWTAAVAAGGRIFVPEGQYTFTSNKTVSGKTGIVFEGESNGPGNNVSGQGAIFRFDTITGDCITFDDCQACGIENVTFSPTVRRTAGWDVKWTGGSFNCYMYDCRHDFGYNAVWVHHATEFNLHNPLFRYMYGSEPFLMGRGSTAAESSYRCVLVNIQADNPYINAVEAAQVKSHADTTAYSLGDIIVENDKIWECTTAGTSGTGTAPSTIGGTTATEGFSTEVTDGTVGWTYRAHANLTWVTMDSYAYSLIIDKAACINGWIGLRMRDTVGAASDASVPKFLWTYGFESDHPYLYGIQLNHGQNAYLISPWVSSALDSHGVAIADAYLGDCQFIGGRVFGSAENGVLVGAGPINWSLIGMTIAGNSQKASDTYRGIELGAGATNGIISGCTTERTDGGSATQQYGLFINSGCDNLVVSGNNFTGNVTGGIAGGAGTTTVRFTGNLGATEIEVVPGALTVVGNAQVQGTLDLTNNSSLYANASTVVWNFDSNDYMSYAKSGNAFEVYIGGSKIWSATATEVTFEVPVTTLTTVVASLPAAGTIGAGARAFVTDANATTFASVVAGGGANGVPVYSDGTDWRIG